MKKVFVCWIVAFHAQAQPISTPLDAQIWYSSYYLLKASAHQPSAQLLTTVGRRFVGTPYQAHTLDDRRGPEQLTVNLRGLDCTTFVETSLAAARTLQRGDTTFEAFCGNLQALRYRRDTVAGYGSRLHYLSDWLYENQQRGQLTDVTRQLGGVPYRKPLNFMTTHRAAYPALADSAAFNAMRRVEAGLAKRTLYYIPKKDVARAEAQLREGDVIAITTTVAGLDCSHVGLATRQNGRVYLLHASQDQQRVTVGAQPLADYLLGHKAQSGIIVARPRE